MHLLYCDADGVVVAIHEDVSVLVPLAAYPSAVRIIPYDAPLTTLARVGPPPIDMGPRALNLDSRPYAQPDPTPDILKLYAGQVRFTESNKGFVFTAVSGDVPVWTDRQSQMLLASLTTWAATVPDTTAVNFTQGGVAYVLTAGEAIALFNQFTALIQDCRNAEATCLTDLNSGAPTMQTYEAVDAAFAGSLKGVKTAERPLPRML